MMEKQNLRMLLLLAMAVVGMFLFNAWQQEHTERQKSTRNSEATKTTPVILNDLPKLPEHHGQATHAAKDANTTLPTNVENALVVDVHTDVMNLKITRAGGDIVFLEFPQYPVSLQQKEQGFVLLDRRQDRNYIVQSGLLSNAGPDSHKKGRAVYATKQAEYNMTGDTLVVDFEYTTKKDVKITKRFSFKKGSYAVGVEYLINNAGKNTYNGVFYGRLRRTAPDKSAAKGMATRTYTGAAVTTPEKKYLKLPFSDMEKKAFKQTITNGWAAMEEHYFTSAWIPVGGAPYQYHTEAFSDQTFSVGFVGQHILVGPGDQTVLGATLYVGPGVMKSLQELAPGLELTVDYGVLWWICQPIFHLMSWLYSLIGNWGAAIILVTVLIKLAFYKLSAASYRSMGNMRKLQPKMEALKARFGDDKQKFGQAVMELYKKEKINPLGGCLPILVQIPVFIALYYVLLESVELRQAPFALWIHDLSTKDPFYVLPLIMGISMFFQQRMNPAPPDPVQAKVMMAMPLVFTVLFLQFPSGLVLYWVVNNLLSILQQWMITRRMEGPSGKGK